MFSPGWQVVQQGIFDYIKTLTNHLDRAGSKLVLAGELNAVVCPEHRSNGNLLTIDRAMQANLVRCGLDSCFTAEPSVRQHTCKSMHWAARHSSSRIDTFITLAHGHGSQRSALTSAGRDYRDSVLHDAIFESSDHCPAQLHLQHLSSILHANGINAKPALDERQEAQKCRINVTSFPTSMLQEWQADFQSAHAAEIAGLHYLIRDAPIHDRHLMTTIVTSIDALISHAVHLAQDCFPCHASARQLATLAKGTNNGFCPEPWPVSIKST